MTYLCPVLFAKYASSCGVTFEFDARGSAFDLDKGGMPPRDVVIRENQGPTIPDYGSPFDTYGLDLLILESRAEGSIEIPMAVTERLSKLGFRREGVPGYMGLIVDPSECTVRRVGRNHTVTFGLSNGGRKAWDLFLAIYKAEDRGILPRSYYRRYGSADACRNAVTEIRAKLSPLGVTVAQRQWRLQPCPPDSLQS